MLSRTTPPKAFISGITGQDGSYLAEFLLVKGYEVHGIIRRTSIFNTDRLDHIYSDPHEREVALHLHYGDLANAACLSRLINQIQPDEVYNLGAQSHVRTSFDQAEYTADVVATGTLRLLEAFRDYASETGRMPRFIQGVLFSTLHVRMGRRASCSTCHAFKTLGWYAQIPLEQGVASTYQW